MDEPTNPPAATGSGRPAIAAAVRLSPLQEAWSRFVAHAVHCPICRSVDAGPCGTAGELYRAFEKLSTDAFRQLTGEAG